jgi:hypothetical protein
MKVDKRQRVMGDDDEGQIGCFRKHAVSVQIEHVWMKVDKRQRVMGDDDEGQIGSEKVSERYILQGEEALKMQGILEGMSDYFDLSL